MKFAVMLANRGFFPGELIAGAREDLRKALAACGHEALFMEGAGTRYDAVETMEEGRKFADFLAARKGQYDGVILSQPNFGDENGAFVALRDAGVPILVQAYPDEAGLMDFAHRRDALCGKLAMCNVLRQAGIRHSLTRRFCVKPDSADFAEDLRLFAATCRVANGMRRVNVGAIGARTTAFKTVRFDEVAFMGAGINVETIDLSLVFKLMDEADPAAVAAMGKRHADYADFGTWPEEKAENLARLGVALDIVRDRFGLDAMAIRCWDELQLRYGIAPCLAMSVLNQDGLPASCEMDVDNAVMMRAINLASGAPVAVFDVNNNFGDAADRCIMFHCSAMPAGMMVGKPSVGEHAMFRKAYGAGSGVGILNAPVAKSPLTVGSLKTENGKVCAFVTEGEITDDKIEEAFFGTGFVFRKDDGDCEAMLRYMARNGYRHHVSFAAGKWAAAIAEAFGTYLGYAVDRI